MEKNSVLKQTKLHKRTKQLESSRENMYCPLCEYCQWKRTLLDWCWIQQNSRCG